MCLSSVKISLSQQLHECSGGPVPINREIQGQIDKIVYQTEPSLQFKRGTIENLAEYFQQAFHTLVIIIYNSSKYRMRDQINQHNS